MKGKNVLIVPLNWGLGHASRIIPIIRTLTEEGACVSVSGSPEQLSLLTSEFNDLLVISLPYLKINLGKNKSQIFHLFQQLPLFVFQIIREHHALKKIIRQKPFDLIISDNCYGLWNKRVRSIFITHQLNIQLPRSIKFLQPAINFITHCLIRNFDKCWIPDFEEDNGLSGLLSHPVPNRLNVTYIGPLSRFILKEPAEKEISDKHKKKLLCIISGPEKQRTIFEECLLKESNQLDDNFTCEFIRGLPGQKDNSLPQGWFNHLPTVEMQEKILQADLIVCRSGYSTIMDLFALRKTAIFVPTPGQTEQEYLARYLNDKGLYLYQEQDKLDIIKGIEVIDKYQQQINSVLLHQNKYNRNSQNIPGSYLQYVMCPHCKSG